MQIIYSSNGIFIENPQIDNYSSITQIDNFLKNKNNEKSFLELLSLNLDMHNQIGYVLKNVGMLKTSWINDQNKITSINHATAFAVTNRLIIGCQHSIFHQKKRKYCDKLSFFPNFNGDLNDTLNKYDNAHSAFYKCQFTEKQFSVYPLSEEITLIVLDHKIQNTNFLKLGSLNLNKGTEITIVGYPSSIYQSVQDQKQIILGRKIVPGKIDSIEDYIIHHTVDTSSGQSGSPILVKLQSGEYVAVGIHTHKRSDNIGSGIYFTKEIIEKIKLFEQQLRKAYQLTQEIEIQYVSYIANIHEESESSLYKQSKIENKVKQYLIQQKLIDFQTYSSQQSSINLYKIKSSDIKSYITESNFIAETGCQDQEINWQITNLRTLYKSL